MLPEFHTTASISSPTSDPVPVQSQVIPQAPSPNVNTASKRSARVSYQSLWLSDYVTKPDANSIFYPLSNYVSYTNLSISYQKCLGAFSAIHEPLSYQEAVKNSRWIKAIQYEIKALQDNHTWDLVSLSPGKIPIGCRWVYKVKLKSNGEIKRFKTRLVAKGYTQKEGLDFHETFSSVVKMTAVRTVLSLAA